MIWLANGDKVLYQWSRGNVLLANTQFDIFRISREDDQKTVEVTPTKSGMLLRAAIPDRLMTESGYLRVACVVRKNDGETVAESVRFTIRAAQRPKDYVYGSGETADWKVLRAQMNAILRDVREGKFNGLPGQDGATPYIGENKHWYISGIDTGIRAEGLDYILTREDKEEVVNTISEAFKSTFEGLYTSGIISGGDEDAMKAFAPEGDTIRVRIPTGTVLIEGVAKTFNTHTRSFNLLLPDETRREVGLWRLVKETGVIEQKWRRVEILDGGYFSEEDQAFLPIRDDNYYDLLNCYVEIPAGAAAITDDMITDLRRDPLLCGFVESKLLDGVVTSVNGIRPDENGNVTVEVSGGESSDVIGELYTDGVLAADDPDALMVTVGGYDEETRTNTINMAAGTLIIDGKVFRLHAVSEEFYRATSSSYNLAYGYRYNVKTGVIEAKLWKGYTGFVTQEDGLPLKLIVDGEQVPVRHGDYYDIVCALIEKPTLTYEITQDMVTDVRGVERFCGYSASKIGALSEAKADKIMTSPDGTKWVLTVGNDGTVTATKYVGEPVPATGITLNPTALTFNDSANQYITATLTPADSTDEVVWTSSNDGIVIVSGGKVTPIANGTATITATAGSVSATCEVTVNIEKATTYRITRNITNAVGFDDAETIGKGSELLECYISADECTMDGATVTVTMGGVDITETAWDIGVVNIAKVTGDVVITLDAVKIQYVVPPVEDFTVQVHEGALLLKSYTGTETAIEMPTTLTHNGTEYTVPAGKLKLYSFDPGKTVKHFKCGEMPYFTSRYALPTYNPTGADYSIRTIDAYGMGLYLGASNPNLERFPVLDCSDKNALNTADNMYMGKTGIRTLQGLIYPNAQTDLDWAYMGAVNLIDGGTIPANITNIKNLFYGCTNLRRVRIEGKEFTNKTDWAYGVTNLTLQCYTDSTLFAGMRYNPNIKWAFEDIGGGVINRILCFGDSLSEGTYEDDMVSLCPANAMVNSLGNGGYNSEQIYQKMVNGTYDKRLKDSIIVIWHGTNGYGTDGYDGVAAKMVAALDGNQRYLLIPPTAQGAGDEVYESWVATYGAEHVLSMGDWFANNGYTVSEYQTDGTHFTADGYALVAQAVYEKILHWL